MVSLLNKLDGKEQLFSILQTRLIKTMNTYVATLIFKFLQL